MKVIDLLKMDRMCVSPQQQRVASRLRTPRSAGKYLCRHSVLNCVCGFLRRNGKGEITWRAGAFLRSLKGEPGWHGAEGAAEGWAGTDPTKQPWKGRRSRSSIFFALSFFFFFFFKQFLSRFGSSVSFFKLGCLIEQRARASTLDQIAPYSQPRHTHNFGELSLAAARVDRKNVYCAMGFTRNRAKT